MNFLGSASTPRDREDSPIPHATPLSLLQAVALLCAPFQFYVRWRHREPSSFDRRGTPGREHDRRGKASSPGAPALALAMCGTSRTQLARCMLVGHGSLERTCNEPSYLRSGPCLLGIAAPKLLWVLKAAAGGGGASLACASRRGLPPAQQQTLRCRWYVRFAREESLHETPAAFLCVRIGGGTQR